MYNLLEGNFDGCELSHIGRASNEEADALANIGSTCEPIPPGVFLEQISECSIKIKPAVNPPESTTSSGAAASDNNEAPVTAEEQATSQASAEVLLIEPTWTRPYLAYPTSQELPKDPTEARQIIRRSKAYTIINGELYKWSIYGILQRCIAPEEGKSILLDIHEGICGHHANIWALVAKAFRAGFYWLTAVQDAKSIVSKCDACQRFATKPHAHAAELKTIPLSWPFAQWGLDMVGKLQKSSCGGHTYLLVAVDKFTKWIVAVPVTSGDATSAMNFFKLITCRFGVPHSIITDNGSNFTSGEFQDFCEELGIKISYASVAHPQINGQVEKANGLVCSSLKKWFL
ncbi:hypothetical protein ACQ4PT_029301 [Festuca glaucescens]